MNHVEAMKQALKALETLARYENPETRVQVRKPRDGNTIVTMYPHKVATNAADVLRAAIAEAEKSNIRQVINLYDEPPAAPVQEPVAWVDVHDYTNLYYRKPAQVDVVPLYYGPATPPAAYPEFECPRCGHCCFHSSIVSGS